MKAMRPMSVLVTSSRVSMVGVFESCEGTDGDLRDIEDKEEIVSSVGQSAVICPSHVNLC